MPRGAGEKEAGVAATRTSRGARPALTVEAIGAAAGRVWQFLRANGRSSLPAIKSGIGVPDSMGYLALGWLAREGKLHIHREGRTPEFSLTE
jgi:hypothetical protein